MRLIVHGSVVNCKDKINTYASVGAVIPSDLTTHMISTSGTHYEGRFFPKQNSMRTKSYLAGFGVSSRFTASHTIVCVIGSKIEYPFNFESQYNYKIFLPDYDTALAHLFLHEYHHYLSTIQPRQYPFSERGAEQFAHMHVQSTFNMPIKVIDRWKEKLECEKWIRPIQKKEPLKLTPYGRKKVEELTNKDVVVTLAGSDKDRIWINVEDQILKIRKAAYRDFFIVS